jgi:hypothetical protein
VDLESNFDLNILNPRNNGIGGVQGYIAAGLPPLHLHFIRAADTTLISLSWSHVLMDALGVAEIVHAWEEDLSDEAMESNSHDTLGETNVDCESKDQKAVLDTKPDEMFSFTKDIELDPSWAPPFWIKLDIVRVMTILWGMLSNWYWYPSEYGCLYIPGHVIESWKRDAEKELEKGSWVSTTDLVSAWMCKVSARSSPLSLSSRLVSSDR